MKNIKQDSLIAAMQYLGLRQLPEVEDKNNIWVKALALVRKADGSESYVYVTKDINIKNKCIADFGNISAIKEYVEFYPISHLQQNVLPKFKTKGKDERIKHLVAFCNAKESDLSSKSVKELDYMVLCHAIKTQIENEKNFK
jgi:hypothetical protein